MVAIILTLLILAPLSILPLMLETQTTSKELARIGVCLEKTRS